MTVKELYCRLNSLIPAELSCEWDNDGDMCIPLPEREVRTVLISLDPSQKAIDAAIGMGAELIITHHPLIFRPLKHLSGTEPCSDKIISLVKNGIALFSFHTRLDALDGGVNDTLCEQLAIENTEKFGPDGEKLGRIGTLPEAVSAEAFAEFVKVKLGSHSVELCDSGKDVRRVALLGGDGGDFLLEAVKAGADIFLTGSIGYNKHNEAAEYGISVLTAGHFFTENPVCASIERMLSDIAPDIKAVQFSSNEIKTI